VNYTVLRDTLLAFFALLYSIVQVVHRAC